MDVPTEPVKLRSASDAQSTNSNVWRESRKSLGGRRKNGTILMLRAAFVADILENRSDGFDR